jgi:hypothetical protein
LFQIFPLFERLLVVLADLLLESLHHLTQPLGFVFQQSQTVDLQIFHSLKIATSAVPNRSPFVEWRELLPHRPRRTDSALLGGVMATTGEMLSQVLRSLDEAVMLLNQMGEVAGDSLLIDPQPRVQPGNGWFAS